MKPDGNSSFDAGESLRFPEAFLFPKTPRKGGGKDWINSKCDLSVANIAVKYSMERNATGTRLERDDNDKSGSMPAEIPPKMSVSSFAGFLKWKSGLMLYERWNNREF